MLRGLVVFLYDVFHDLSNQGKVLRELHRVLKPGGTLSCSDHHLKEGELIGGITGGGLFKAGNKGRFAYTFFPTA